MNDATLLATLIDEYRKSHGPRLDEYLGCFRALGSLETAIDVVFFQRDGATIHGHQRRIGRDILLNEAVPALQRHAQEIAACQSFSELLNCIKRRTSDIYRFGVLARYDTALRLGAHLGLSPEVVYVHAGARTGSKQLGMETSGGTVEMEKLPEPLQALVPYHAENFLCIFKSQVAGTGGKKNPCGAANGRSC